MKITGDSILVQDFTAMRSDSGPAHAPTIWECDIAILVDGAQVSLRFSTHDITTCDFNVLKKAIETGEPLTEIEF